MFNKKIQNRIKFGIGILLCAVAVLFTPTMTITSYAAETTDVEVCADYKEWVYKIMDGKLYKALLNRTTGLLETDWIFVRDWTEGDL